MPHLQLHHRALSNQCGGTAADAMDVDSTPAVGVIGQSDTLRANHVARLDESSGSLHVGTGSLKDIDVQNTRKRRKENTKEAMSYPRKRAVKACRLCRARKTKCNNDRPSCSFCSSLGAVCVYDDPKDLSTLDPASLIIIERLDHILEKLDQNAPQPPTPAGLTSSVTLLSNGSDPVGIEIIPQASIEPQDSDEALTFLKIPPCRTSPDAILAWPIFEGRYPPNYINECLFAHEVEYPGTRNHSGIINENQGHSRMSLIDEEAIPRLTEQFLTRVHIKNPILDVGMIRKYARTVSQEGPRFDAPSCLVLMVCALGCIARPFNEIYELDESDQDSSSLRVHAISLNLAEAYFDAARKRFGLLGNDILATQCIFLSGVYLMYSLQPLRAWRSFAHASSSFNMYLKCQEAYYSQDPSLIKADKTRRMEISLYWTCYKSECELRTELPLPDSGLSEVHFPYPLPTPPESGSPAIVQEMDEMINSFFNAQGESSPKSQRSDGGLDRLQEQTWYYYLTEITLRRIGNRILHAFYRTEHRQWNESNIHDMIRAADTFENQLVTWYAALPEPIRFQDSNAHPGDELQYMIQVRVLEIKSWLYRPFLYFAIHHQRTNIAQSKIQLYAQKAIACSVHYIEGRPALHRHHGSWYVGRTIITSSLLVLAAVKTGISVVTDNDRNWTDVICTACSVLSFWSEESPDFARGKSLLEDICAKIVTGSGLPAQS